ncbi:MAG: leucyl aminopeptidase [Actinomycetota bacterium]|nr:leucyl aminopeptidase [Actinomycetota bacterium]
MPPQVLASEEAVETVSADAVVVGAFKSDDGVELSRDAKALDDALDGQLSEHLTQIGFKAKVAEVALVPTLGRLPARTVVVAGLGGEKGAGRNEVMRAAGSAARRLTDRATIASTLHQNIADDGAVGGAAEGFLLGSYKFTIYKSDPHPSKIERIAMLGGPDSEVIERGVAAAEATVLARDLTNEPAATLYPETLAERAREMADVAGLSIEVLDEKQLAERGFGGVITVGKGSDNPPRLIVMRYKPDNPKGRLGLVGKGITFDSGGYSIKPGGSMETMKTDMGGAAAVIGAMSALGRLKPSIEVIGVVSAAENMVSGRAVKPGDVINHYGGGTSEVLNTDAEGRLVLADALAYACEQGVDAVVNVATLTGGIVVALGPKATGLFSNDDELSAEVAEAAQRAGERVWPMPLYDDYRSDIDSEVADIKNTGSRWGSAIKAALFLRNFVADGVPWAHLDIAGPARIESGYDEVPKGGSGVATRTLIAWIEGRAS